MATTAAAAPAGLTYTADSGSAAGKLAGTPSTAGIWTLTYEAMDAGGAGSGDDKTDSIGFTLSVVADSAPVMDATRKSALSAAPFTYPPGAIVGADAATAFALPVVTGGNGTVAETLTTTCALNGGSCAADAVTTLGANTVPKGLTFAVAAGDTPAGLTGTFGSPGIYTLTYSVTDTAIDNGAYQSADDTDEDSVLFTLMVQGAAAKIKDIDPISLARSTSDTPSATTIDLYQHFSPSSGLDFTLDSSNEKVLTVAETGGVLTLTATQAGGTSDVTVTASNAATSTDPSTSFRVTVTPTTAPVFSAGNLETLSKGLTIAVGVAVPLGDYFSDADSDALSYKLLDSSDAEQDSITYQQSSTDVLTATISGATLTLAGVAKTSADLPIEVRATDTGGNSATGSFAATVTNTAPMTVGASPAITLAHGQSDSISDVTALFSDAESDSLTYTYSSTDTASLTATGVDGNGVLTGTSLTLTAAADIAATSASATLTASDGKGQAEQTITVAISNAAPALSGTAQPPLALLIGGASASIDLSTLFSDADSTLSYTATSSAATVASLNTDANDVPVSSGTPTSSLEITAEAVGSATLTLSANDRVTRSGVSNPSLTVAVTVAADSRPTLATAVADQTYTLGQTPAALTLPLATANTGNGTLTYTLSGSFTPTGGGGGAITVDDEGDIVQGATDTGLDFTDVSGATAASIGGVPTAAGALALTWTLSDGDQNEDVCTGLSPLAPAGCDTDFDSFAITLNAAPTFGAATVADVSAAVNTAISSLDLPRATAGTAPLAYRLTGVVVSGAALGSTTLGSVAHQHPAGLTFALSSSGATEAATLVGTPTAAGVYSMTWTATDANSIGTSAAFQIIVSGSTPLFVGTVADQSLSAQLAIAAQTLPAAAGGTGTLTYSLTGAIASGSTGLLASGLPQGLAFDADTRVLSGEPTVAAAGAYDMTYSATDTATPPNVATLAFQLTVAANEAPVFSDAAKALVAANYNYLTGTAISALVLPEAEGGEGALSYSLTATAGTAANISNNLPAGLSFNSGSRELTGTPTAADSYSLTYAADDTDSNTASSDTATIAFTAVVEADTAPTLTPSTAVTASGNKDRVLTAIALPQAGAGNFGLSDSLEGGTYTPEGASPTTTTIGVESDGTILTDGTDATTDSGLVFMGRTGAGAGAVATITGTPSVTGTFSLTYRVSDGDSNTSASTDEATVAVTLTVTDPALTLAGGVADGAGILLKREASTALTTAISLPRVSTPVGAVTYVLKATQTHDSSGAISTPSEATVATTAAAAPAGLTYTADSGSAAGKLAGTPSTVGVWTLTYEAMDAGGAGSGDDKTDSIGFTLSVVADSAPVMDVIAKPALSSQNFNYPTRDTVGVDSATAFPLLSFAGGTAPITESLTTTCALNGGSCAADAVTTLGANTVPKGLTFAVAAGDTPAGLTGTFGSPGVYTLTYRITDTAIDNTTTYQSADGADADMVRFTFTVLDAAAKIKDIENIASLARSTADTTSTTTVDLYQHFSPSSGLDFTVDSSNEKVLTVAETGGVLTLTATQAGGTSEVTVSASNLVTSTDPSTSFEVTVTPTTAPVFSAGNLETLSKGLTVALDVELALGDYFSDADSDALSYKLLDSSDAEQDSITYQQSSTDVLTATISGPPDPGRCGQDQQRSDRQSTRHRHRRQQRHRQLRRHCDQHGADDGRQHPGPDSGDQRDHGAERPDPRRLLQRR